MNIIFIFLALTNILFLIRNVRFLTVLRKNSIRMNDACGVYLSLGKRRMVVSGTFIGVAFQHKHSLVSDTTCYLDNAAVLCFNGYYDVVSKKGGVIAYGDNVIVSGVIDYGNSDFIVRNIDTIVVKGNKKLIDEYLSKQYAKSSLLALLIVGVTKICMLLL